MNRTIISPAPATLHQAPELPVLAARHCRLVKEGYPYLAAIFYFLGIILFLVGLVIWLLLPFGILLFIAGSQNDGKQYYVYTCGNCGNNVVYTSVLCPHCHAQFLNTSG